MKTWLLRLLTVALLAVFCLGGLLPPVQVSLAQEQSPPRVEGTWVTITEEGFEGTWPSAGWTAYDANGSTGGELYWDEDDFKPYAGTKSAWCANGGANGRDPQYSQYADNMDSWAVYGPFSLADATDAELSFYVWNASEPTYDYFRWLASADCTNFYGYEMSIPTTGWDQWTMDLTSVPTIGDLTGDPSVCIAFRFTSDGSVTNTGAFVDGVLLRKYIAADCYTLTTSVAPPGSGTVLVEPAPNCGSGYTDGTQVELRAVPNAGYDFYYWSGDGSGTNNPLYVNMTENKSITANFSAGCYRLTRQKTGLGQNPTATPPNSIGCNPDYYIPGELITLTPHPANGWALSYWEGTNGQLDNKLTMPGAAHTVVAHYEQPATQVIAGSAGVQPGEEVVIPLTFWNPLVKTLGAATIGVKYDKTVLAVVGCDADPDGLFDDAACEIFGGLGAVRFSALSAAGVDVSVLLANITFVAIGGIGDSSDLKVVIQTFVDPSGAAIPVTAVNGMIWIGDADGDVNCDGLANVTDAQWVMQYVVQSRFASNDCPPPPGGIYLPACDVSGDGHCTVTDALFIYQCSVGIPNPFCPPLGAELGDRWPAPQGSVALTLGAAQATADGTLTLPIRAALGNQALGGATVQLALDPAAYEVLGCTADQASALDEAVCNVDAAAGTVRFSGIAAEGVTGNVLLAEVTLRQRDGASTDSAPVLTAPVLVDPAGRPIEVTVHYGVTD